MSQELFVRRAAVLWLCRQDMHMQAAACVRECEPHMRAQLLQSVITQQCSVHLRRRGFSIESGLELCRWCLSDGSPPDTVLQRHQCGSCLRCENAWDGYHIGYRCYTCAKSEHSCICIECFNAGDHEGHDYRLFQSQSGGCCDCGDLMAWQRSGFCSRHDPDAPVDMDALLSPGVKAAAPWVLDVAVWTLVWTLQRVAAGGDDGVLSDAKFVLDWLHDLSKVNDAFRVLICNALLREDYVLMTRTGLILGTDAPPFDGLDMVPDHGTDRIVQMLLANGADATAVSSLSLVAGDFLSGDLSEDCTAKLDFMCDDSVSQTPDDCFVSGTSSALSVLFERVGFEIPDPLLETLGYFYIKCLLHPHFKLMFTRRFVRNYARMIDAMLPSFDGTNGQVPQAPPVSKFLDLLSCQLFHDPIHVGQLVHEDQLLLRLLSKLDMFMTSAADARGFAQVFDVILPWRECFNMMDQGSDTADMLTDEPTQEATLESEETCGVKLVLDCVERKVHEQLFMRLCADLRSIINHTDIALHVVATPRLLELLTQVLSRLHAANPHRRQTEHHVEFESRGWQYAFILEFEAAGVLKPVVHAFGEAGTPAHLARAVIFRCSELLLRWRGSHDAGWLVHSADSTVLQQEYSFADDCCYRVSRDAVSFHLTLHRCVTAFVFEMVYRNHAHSPTLEELWCLAELPPSFMAFLCDHPLRIQVLCAQIEAHKWIRNGQFTMHHQVSLYRNRLWHEMGMDLDFFLMQCSAQILSNNFILLALHRFELATFFNSERTADAFDGDTIGIAVDFLMLILAIGRDRTRVGMAKEDALRREIVCWLAVTDLTYSQLLDRMHPRFTSNVDTLDQVLATVATYQDPQDDDDARLYRLRDALWVEVDPLFLRYNKSDRATLEERRRGKQALICTTSLDLELLWPTFACLPAAIFQSYVLHRIILMVIIEASRCIADHDDAFFAVQPLLQLGLQALLYALLCDDDNQRAVHSNPIALQQMAQTSLASVAYIQNDILTNLCTPVTDECATMLHILCKMETMKLPKGADILLPIKKLLDSCAQKSETCRKIITEQRIPRDTGTQMDTDQSAERARREAAEKRKASILAQFAQQQQAFMAQNFGSSDESDDETVTTNEADDFEADTVSAECALCQQAGTGLMLTLVTMQRTCLASHVGSGKCGVITEPAAPGIAHSADDRITPIPMDEADSGVADSASTAGSSGQDRSIRSGGSRPGRIVLQSCGHTVHRDCLRSYQAAVATHEDSDNLLHHAGGEFACPICRQLCNSALPLLDSWTPSSPTNPEQETALIEFLGNVKSRHGLQTENEGQCATGELAKNVIQDAVVLTEIAARDSSSGGWFDYGQEKFLTDALRALGRLRSWTRTSSGNPSCGPAAASYDVVSMWLDDDPLDEQFVAHFWSDEAAYSSFDSFCEAALIYYTCAVVQAAMAICLAVGNKLLAVDLARLPFFRCLREYADIQTWIARGCSSGDEITDYASFVAAISSATLTFVRRTVILAHLRFGGICSIGPLADAAALTGSDNSPECPAVLAALASLKIPSIDKLMRLEGGAALTAAVATAGRHLAHSIEPSGGVLIGTAAMMWRQHMRCASFDLVQLPEVYVNLLLQYQGCRCRGCGCVPEEPAMCLACGQLFCFKNRNGSGECTRHTANCSGDVGAWLVLKACAICVLLGGGRQCIWGPIYLDAHGEKDAYLQRGKTLFLQPSKYRALARSMAHHSIVPSLNTKNMMRRTNRVHGNPP